MGKSNASSRLSTRAAKLFEWMTLRNKSPGINGLAEMIQHEMTQNR
jgi:hypothetical protein